MLRLSSNFNPHTLILKDFNQIKQTAEETVEPTIEPTPTEPTVPVTHKCDPDVIQAFIDQNIEIAYNIFRKDQPPAVEDTDEDKAVTGTEEVDEVNGVEEEGTSAESSAIDDISIDSDFQAKNTAVTTLDREVNATYQILFGEDISYTDLSADEIKENLSSKFEESPLAKLAYVNQESSTLLQAADEGILTVEDCYENAKDTLLATYPNADETYEARVSTLSLEEIKEFQDEILSLPASSDANYSDAVEELNYKFLSSTEGKPAYELQNSEATMSFEDTFKYVYSIEYNEENINTYNEAQTTYAVMQATETARKAIHNNLNDAQTDGEIETGILNNVAMYAASDSDEDMTTSLQKLTNMSDISIVDGKIVGDVSEIKTNMLETVDARALELYTSYSSTTNSINVHSMSAATQSVGVSAKARSVETSESSAYAPYVSFSLGNVQVNSSMTRSVDFSGASRSTTTSATVSTSELAEAAFADATANLENTYATAYGEKTAEQLNNAAKNDKSWVDYTKTAIEGVGMAISIAGCFAGPVGPALVLAGAGITSFAGVGFEMAVELVDGLKNGSINTEKMKELLSEMGTNAALFVAGMGAGAVGAKIGSMVGKVASSTLGKYVSSITNTVKNSITNAASFLADKGSDFLLSITGNAIITGDMNVSGESLAQVISVAIPAAKQLKNSGLGSSSLSKLGISSADVSSAITKASSEAIFSGAENKWIDKTFGEGVSDEVKEALVDIANRMFGGETPNSEMYNNVIENMAENTGLPEKKVKSLLDKALTGIGWTNLKGCLESSNPMSVKVKKATETIIKNIETNAKKQQTETPVTPKEEAETPAQKDGVTAKEDTDEVNSNKHDGSDDVKNNPNSENKVNTDDKDSPVSNKTDAEKYDKYIQQYPGLENLKGYNYDDVVKAGDLLENFQKNATPYDYADFDTTDIYSQISNAGLSLDKDGSVELCNMIKQKYYPEVVEWENFAKNMMDKYGFNSAGKVKDAESATKKIKDILENRTGYLNNEEDIGYELDMMIRNGEFGDLSYRDLDKLKQYVLDDADIQKMLKPNNKTPDLNNNGITNSNPTGGNSVTDDVLDLINSPVNKDFLNNEFGGGTSTGQTNAGFNNDLTGSFGGGSGYTTGDSSFGGGNAGSSSQTPATGNSSNNPFTNSSNGSANSSASDNSTPHRPETSTPDALPGSSISDTPTSNPSEVASTPDFGNGSIVDNSGNVYIPNSENSSYLQNNTGDTAYGATSQRDELSQDDINNILNDANQKYGDNYDVQVNQYGDVLLTPKANSTPETSTPSASSSSDTGSNSSAGSTSSTGSSVGASGGGIDPGNYINSNGTFDTNGFINDAVGAGWDMWTFGEGGQNGSVSDVWGALSDAQSSGNWDAFWGGIDGFGSSSGSSSSYYGTGGWDSWGSSGWGSSGSWGGSGGSSWDYEDAAMYSKEGKREDMMSMEHYSR